MAYRAIRSKSYRNDPPPREIWFFMFKKIFRLLTPSYSMQNAKILSPPMKQSTMVDFTCPDGPSVKCVIKNFLFVSYLNSIKGSTKLSFWYLELCLLWAHWKSLKIWFTLSKNFFTMLSLILPVLTFFKKHCLIIMSFTVFNFIFLAFKMWNRHLHLFFALAIVIIDAKSTSCGGGPGRSVVSFCFSFFWRMFISNACRWRSICTFRGRQG